MYQSIEEAPTEGDFSIKNSGRGKALAHSASEFKRHYLIRALLVSLMCGVVLLGLDGHGSPQLTDAVGRNSRGVSTFLSENNVKPCEEYSLQCCSDPSAPVLGGVDVVAYFQIVPGSYAVMGSPEFFSTLRTSDAEYTFFFSSLENKEYFDDDPWQYIPEYGGFDAGALTAAGEGAAVGGGAPALVGADANQWAVLRGRLYLFRDNTAEQIFRGHATERVAEGDSAWGQLYDSRWVAAFAPAPRTALLTRCAAAGQLPNYVTAGQGQMGSFAAAAAAAAEGPPSGGGGGADEDARGSREEEGGFLCCGCSLLGDIIL